MALTQISTGGVKDDAVTAGKIPAGAVGSSEIAKPIDLADNEKIRFGTGNDLSIYHDGSNSYVKDAGSGILILDASQVQINNAGSTENLAKFIPDGAVELYYDGDLHFATTADGVKTNGDLSFRGDGDTEQILFDASDASLKFIDNKKAKFGTGGDLQIFHDGSNSYITNITGTIHIQGKSGENSIKTSPDGAVELYYDNVKKIETTSAGVSVTGTVSDTAGELRSIPIQTETSAHTPNASSAGYVIYTTHGVTINNSVFSTGDALTIVNNSGSDITITQGSGLTLYNTADAATGNRTLAGRGMATMWFASASVAYISGAGLS